jgi:hypothetical protein
MPILSMRAPRVPVKYFVVNHAKASGLFRAKLAKRTVHTGNNVVRVSVVFRYISQALEVLGVDRTGATTSPTAFSDIIRVVCTRLDLSLWEVATPSWWLCLTNEAERGYMHNQESQQEG